MRLYDSEKRLDLWLISHIGMFMRCDPIHWDENAIELSEYDCSILHAQANDIMSLARSFCPHRDQLSINIDDMPHLCTGGADEVAVAPRRPLWNVAHIAWFGWEYK
jgi:hypothetical protein